MNIVAVHSFLVHPAKNTDPQPLVRGTPVLPEERLFQMLRHLYERAPHECHLDITFQPHEDGTTDNPSKDALEAYNSQPTFQHGQLIAQRLQVVTTKRSGLGLFFLVKGRAGGSHRLVIARFPAEEGVVAQENAGALSVEFIERVFMKNARAYKSALFETTSLDAGFLEGQAVDRQLGPDAPSQYWINDFLLSSLRTTGPFGSRRLATALRQALNNTTNHQLKAELISITHLLRNQNGQIRTARDFLHRLGAAPRAITAIERSFGRPALMDETFRFDAAEFNNYISYRVVELNNTAILMALDSEFDNAFQAQPLAAENSVRYVTEGKIIDQRYRRRK